MGCACDCYGKNRDCYMVRRHEELCGGKNVEGTSKVPERGLCAGNQWVDG